MSRRPRAIVVLAIALALVGLLAAGLAWVLDTPRPSPGASRGERLYLAYCTACHGEDGRRTWRAVLFMIHPGDLAKMDATVSDQYVFDIIKHGGSPIGRPGMPAYGGNMSDHDIRELVRYVRELARRR